MDNRFYAWFVRGEEHANMCRTSVESVLKADHEAKCCVVTDERNPSWSVPGAILMYIDEGMPIMLANLEAQVSALSWAWNLNYETCTFLDTDTLLVKPLPAYGDIAFTWRDSVGTDEGGDKVEGVATRMPYNYGVVITRPGLKSFEAMIWLRERIRKMHGNHQKWYGNQLAVNELAGGRPQSGMQIVERRIPWKLTQLGKPIQVAKLPCETHNYTPQSVDEDYSSKYVLHFKGAKRHLMKLYALRMGLGWYEQKEAA